MTEKVVMSADETETTINYSVYHIGEWAELYTTDKNVMKRYEKFANQHPDCCKLIDEDKYSMTFSVHPKCVGVYPRVMRKLNDEQKAKSIENLAAYRRSKE